MGEGGRKEENINAFRMQMSKIYYSLMRSDWHDLLILI